MIKKIFSISLVFTAAFAFSPSVSAQFNLGKAANGLSKVAQAVTLSDSQVAEYAKQSIDWMDTHNKVSAPNSEYTKRLNRLTAGLTDADGIPLNFKVYEVIDVNAFACPDGSVRVFSSLMDIMSDDELLGIIGHEIGHVAKHHSKKAMKQELLTGAAKDAVSSYGGTVGKLADSQLGSISEALAGAKYSQKQEKEADDYGYEFLKSKGKNPWGMVMSFEKFLTLEGNQAKSSYITKMFSSHPETKDRIKRLSDRCKKDGIARPQ